VAEDLGKTHVDEGSRRSIRTLTLAGVTQTIGTGVIAGGLFTVALLGAMGVAVLLIAMVGSTVFEDGMAVLIAFGLTATLASKLLRLF
jgi:hypothetical protein